MQHGSGTRPWAAWPRAAAPAMVLVRRGPRIAAVALELDAAPATGRSLNSSTSRQPAGGSGPGPVPTTRHPPAGCPPSTGPGLASRRGTVGCRHDRGRAAGRGDDGSCQRHRRRRGRRRRAPPARRRRPPDAGAGHHWGAWRSRAAWPPVDGRSSSWLGSAPSTYQQPDPGQPNPGPGVVACGPPERPGTCHPPAARHGVGAHGPDHRTSRRPPPAACGRSACCTSTVRQPWITTLRRDAACLPISSSIRRQRRYLSPTNDVGSLHCCASARLERLPR